MPTTEEIFAALERKVNELSDALDSLSYSFYRKTGTAPLGTIARDISIGTNDVQYQVNAGGMFTFGDGSDGDAVADGAVALTGATLAANVYTLTRDVYYGDLTVASGVTINPAGYRIFGTGTLTLVGTAIIKRNGNAGSNGATSAGRTNGGAALADGYLKGSVAGSTGGESAANPGGTGLNGGAATNTTNSIGSVGAAGGSGGAGSGGAGGTPSTAGTATASNVKLIANWHLATLLDVGSTGATVKFDNAGSAAGGGGGGVGSSSASGSGGGGGSAGGIVAIYFRVIVIGASASITVNGGNGGNGGSATGGNCGGGGGGGGGNGGQLILVYNQLSNSGSLTATAGTKGTKGTKNGTGTDGSDGVDGTAGTVRSFQISL